MGQRSGGSTGQQRGASPASWARTGGLGLHGRGGSWEVASCSVREASPGCQGAGL